MTYFPFPGRLLPTVTVQLQGNELLGCVRDREPRLFYVSGDPLWGVPEINIVLINRPEATGNAVFDAVDVRLRMFRHFAVRAGEPWGKVSHSQIL